MRKVNFLMPDCVEIYCFGNGDEGDDIKPSLFGSCVACAHTSFALMVKLREDFGLALFL